MAITQADNSPEKAAFERKRLFVDIETSPNIGMFWSAGWKQNISYENIIKERAIICICYKWEGSPEVYHLKWNKKQCDKKMLEAFVKVAQEADEIIGHNGDKFDIAWIRTRCLFHRISMPPKYITTDTLKVARSKFRLNSNRLDYIASFLGLGKKIKTEFTLWKEILLSNDKAAMEKMIEYCKFDVVLLEEVYHEMKNHIEIRINYPALYLSDKTGCPECGQDKLVVNQTRTTLTGIVKRQFECRGCGKYHTRTIPRGEQ